MTHYSKNVSYQTCLNVIILVLLISLLPFTPASAHSSLEKTLPKANATLTKSPKTIELWFEDPAVVSEDSITVSGPIGSVKGKTQVDKADPRHVIFTLMDHLSSGAYSVNYHIITPDGWVLEDNYSFSIKKASLRDNNLQPFQLKRATPGDGVTVKASPKTIDLWFTRPAKVTMLGLFDSRKNIVSVNEPVQDPNDPRHIQVNIDKKLKPGTYQVSWYANPLKGNKVANIKQGVFYFAVRKVTSISPTVGENSQGWLNSIGLPELGYLSLFVALLILFGGAFFNAFISGKYGDQRHWRKIPLFLYGLSFVGLILLIIDDWRTFGEHTLLGFLSLKFVWIPIVQVALLTLGIWFAKGRLSLIIYGAAMLLWPYYSGHSSFPRYGGILSMLIDVVHLFAISIWLGGLTALIVNTPKGMAKDYFKRTGLKYSRWAFWSILVIILTGIMMTLSFVPSFSWNSLVISDWGKTLITKVVLLVVILVLAMWQWLSLRGAKGIKRSAFIGRARAEMIIGILVLLFATTLIKSSPASAEQGIYPKKLEKKGIIVTLDVSPIQIGASDITAHFQNGPQFKNVQMQLSMPPDWQIEHRAFSLGNGTYRITGDLLHAGGTIAIKVIAVKPDGEKIVFPFKIVVPGDIRIEES